MSNVYSFSNAVAKDEDSDERRIAPRRRVLKAGKVAYQVQVLHCECTVRDLSDTGAKLRTDNSVSIPDHFELLIEIDGFEANCEVVWRKDADLGVRFLGAPRTVAPARQQIVQPDTPVKKPSLLKRPIKLD